MFLHFLVKFCSTLRAQVMGWPPVRSFRKNIVSQKSTAGPEAAQKASGGGGALVKVCMDGAPYLRKVDLKMYKSYQEFSDGLAKMFSSFTMGTKLCVTLISRN